MAGHQDHFGGAQMKSLIYPDDQQKSDNKDLDQTKQPSSNPSSEQDDCSPPAEHSNAEDPGTADKHEPVRVQSGEDTFSDNLLKNLNTLKQCDIKLEPLSFSKSHTVLIDVPVFNFSRGIFPQDGRDLWNNNFVKMPCSQASMALSSKGLIFIGTSQVPRWKLISKQLSALASKKSVSVKELEEAILRYNPKYKGRWSFDGLDSFVRAVPKTDNYFDTLFPKIAALALDLPEQVKKAIPLLQRGHHASITLSQVQISCLLANAFFCTFPHRNTSRPDAEYHNYPSINFNKLFESWSNRKKEKLRAIMHYFNVVTEERSKPNGLVTFERCCIREKEVPNWRHCKEKLQKLYVTSQGSIEEEGTGMLQVDFASKWIGGGVLDSGLVQEEILFLMNPELIVSRLFTEKLEDNECLIVTGTQQFSFYNGYSDSFEWAGPFEDFLERDEWARLKRQILAIDALHFRHRKDQYKMNAIIRELNKAYCGFKGHHGHDELNIATGKWGCGAFKGDPQLKALIQLMAAAKAKKDVAFFTFKDEDLSKGLQQIYHLLDKEKITVDKLYKLLEDYCAEQQRAEHSHVHLFEFIKKSIRSSRSQL